MSTGRVRLEPSWKARVGAYLEREDMAALAGFLRARRDAGARLYPPPADIFAAFTATPFDAVRVVVLGQDPYHGAGQANGLAFSVRHGVAVPPSLDNIFKEIQRDLGIARPGHGCLDAWARRGVLLLNSVLTVEDGQAGAHRGRGWEGFTDHVVATLDRECEGLVFLLWGSHAQAKGRVIDATRHRVLRAPHPSPLSAHRGFNGCGHFSACNRYLARGGHAPVDWSLPPTGGTESPEASAANPSAATPSATPGPTRMAPATRGAAAAPAAPVAPVAPVDPTAPAADPARGRPSYG